MPLPVNLKEVIEAIEPLADEWTARINPKTGEIVCFTEEEERMARDEDGRVLQWFVEHVPKVREALHSREFIDLPGRFDFHEHAVMERFAFSLPEPARDRTLQAMRGRGAFRGFKQAIRQEGVEDRWYAWRDQALRDLAVDFLESKGIAYVEG